MHPESVRQRAIELYEFGLSCRAAADQVNHELATTVTPQTVARWARQAGVARPPGDRRHVEVPPEAKRLYESGWSLSDVAKKFGVSPSTLQKRLKETGTSIRPARIKYGHILTADRFRVLYVERNLKVQDIARRFHCSTGSVYNWLKRNHIPLKSARIAKM